MDPKDIKKFRVSKGWSQEKLAKEVGVSFCTVNRWERGRTVPSPMALNMLKKLSAHSTSADNRGSYRRDFFCPIQVRKVGIEEGEGASATDFASFTENLSSTGIMFRGTDGLKVGDKVMVDINLPTVPGNIRTLSEVQWTKNLDGINRVGVRFSGGASKTIDDAVSTMLAN